MLYRKWKIKIVVVLDVWSAAHLEDFLIKQSVLFFFFHVSNVLGVCRGMRMRSLASYAKACTCVKWWYLQQFFFIFSKFSFFSFISKCQKELLRCAPPFSYVCDFFSNGWLWVVLDGKSWQEYPVNAGVLQG